MSPAEGRPALDAWRCQGASHRRHPDDDPVLFIEHKLLYSTKGQVPEGEHVVPLGRAEIKRAGRDVTIVTISHTVLKALRAAARMAAEGIEAEVIDLRTLAPLDLGCVLDSVRRTNRVVIAHEACRRGGFGESWPRRFKRKPSTSWTRLSSAWAPSMCPFRTASPWKST